MYSAVLTHHRTNSLGSNVWVLLLLIVMLPGCSLLFSPPPEANLDAGSEDAQVVSDAAPPCRHSLSDTLHLFSVNVDGSAAEPFLDRGPYLPSLSPSNAVFTTMPGPQACWDAIQLGPDTSVDILHEQAFGGVKSVDFWFRPRALGGSQRLLAKWAGAGGFKLALVEKDLMARLELTLQPTPTTSPITYYTGTKRVLGHWTNHWHHVAVSFDQQGVQLFFNGQNEPNTQTEIGPNNELLTNNVANWAWGGTAFAGDLADLRMRRAPITVEQAKAVYEAIFPP